MPHTHISTKKMTMNNISTSGGLNVPNCSKLLFETFLSNILHMLYSIYNT